MPTPCQRGLLVCILITTKTRCKECKPCSITTSQFHLTCSGLTYAHSLQLKCAAPTHTLVTANSCTFPCAPQQLAVLLLLLITISATRAVQELIIALLVIADQRTEEQSRQSRWSRSMPKQHMRRSVHELAQANDDQFASQLDRSSNWLHTIDEVQLKREH